MGIRPAAGWFAHMRAVLVALHLIAVTLMALPAVGEGMVRSAWKDPTVQEEFADWTARLNRYGAHVTQQQFEDGLFDTASAYQSARDVALKPFLPYYDWCGTLQSWRMFAGPHRYPSRLEIDVEEGGAWRPVYVKSDPRHRWLAAKLDHYRMRPLLYRLGWFRYDAGSPDFDELARWVAGRAAHDFPDAGRVRVRLFSFHTPSPEDVLAGRPVTGEYGPDEVLDLGARR